MLLTRSAHDSGAFGAGTGGVRSAAAGEFGFDWVHSCCALVSVAVSYSSVPHTSSTLTPRCRT